MTQAGALKLSQQVPAKRHMNPLNPLQQDAIFDSRAHRRQWLAAVMGQDDCPSTPAQTAESRGARVLARTGLSQRVATRQPLRDGLGTCASA
jgi:hypothetical protein